MGWLKKLKYLLTSPKGNAQGVKNARPVTFGHVYTQEELDKEKLSSSLQQNIDTITEMLGFNSDFVKREFFLGAEQPLPAVIFYMDGMIDIQELDQGIMRPLLESYRYRSSGSELLKLLHSGGLITRAEKFEVSSFGELIPQVLSGSVILLVEGYSKAIVISCKGYEMRSIPEPVVQNAVRGPRDAFIETLSVNISLVRRRLPTPNLVVETIQVGKVSSTNVAIVHLKGIASEGLVQEVYQRLNNIDIDVILESGYIEQFIQDSPYSPFPQVIVTERPDKVVGCLAEGRVAIFTDNTPLALIVPGEFMSLLQATEDYYYKFYFPTFVRLLRAAAFLVALVLPSLYVAITNFHQEMIPTTLLIGIAAARQGVPFPAYFEALLMELAFETLREAGIRLPSPVGQAVSIVGALIIGQAAVQANIVSPLMVIVVAFTGIATFTIPQFNLGITVRLLRFPLMITAALLGLFGVMVSLLAILLHLCSLRSFGVPYLSPITPFNWQGFKDSLVLAPHWSRRLRPQELVQYNRQSMGDNQKPQPPDKSN
ncbi:spore germination protein [Desulforamulus ferrireducens]|uniref:Spore germination protein n=1 Tax=Desulforamulus ferrireducens TaxID=1833852 RepID=A0A1S6ISS3_9FIRM|nr:spore germination protein [Desulforamulus ferrireducens]AQS57815.1 spore germination protein [Desulforamulus ferrireducens]